MTKFPMTEIPLSDGRVMIDYHPIVELYIIHGEKNSEIDVIDNKIFLKMDKDDFGLYLIIEEDGIRYANDYEDKQFIYKEIKK